MARPTVYLICFAAHYRHARHYLGYTENLRDRLAHHRAGHGSPLLRAVSRAGIAWEVVRVWEDGSRTLERQLKNRKKAARLCPRCRGKENNDAGVSDH